MNNTPIKAALFDLDGIVIVGRNRFFSERLSEEHGIPMEAVQEFFLNDLQKNVDTAHSLGINAHFYDRFDVLKRQAEIILK